MNNLKKMFSFKTVYSENKTFLVFSIGRKEEINYSQVQMLESDTFRSYFLPFQCTKTASTNKISFNISGLTSLSEYLKTEMKQEQYFEMIAGIQKIISFCQKSYLSYDNLICDPKYMYYHNTLKRIMMIYIPLKNPHYVCDNIPKCLKKLHNNAKSVIITDGNYMNKYENYLARFTNSGNKKGTNSFSPDSLLHFFNENDVINSNNPPPAPVNYEPEPVPAQNDFSINSQIIPVIPSGELNNDIRSQMTGQQERFDSDIERTSSATVVRSRRDEVSLTDQSGNKFVLRNFPFTIGRSRDKDLVIPQNTVSGNHATITSENGRYFIKDHSSNGTYLNDENNKISYCEINNGDKLFFDSFCYLFSVVKANSGNEEDDSSRTVMVSRRRQPEQQQQPAPEAQAVQSAPEPNEAPAVQEAPESQKALAYLKRIYDDRFIRIMQYPFRDDEIPGVTFFTEVVNNRTAIFLENVSCGTLVFENALVAKGTTVEIFSGCTLFIDCVKYTFIIEN
ncbi:MAG: FHA domain-containing protein [Ruminococcus sp.]|nr:FHA domain-containing protein [Ruminococcus sp.]